MISDLIELYNFIKMMNEDFKSNKKKNFDSYIDDVYQKSSVVLKDYMEIFSTIRTNINEQNWCAKDVILYIEKVEYKHKDMRIYLRTLKGSRWSPITISHDDYETFLNSVVQLLQCQTGGRELHTLLGFAEICRKSSLYDLEEQQKIIGEYTQGILECLEITWEKICNCYNNIKNQST